MATDNSIAGLPQSPPLGDVDKVFDSAEAPLLAAKLPGIWDRETHKSTLFSYFGNTEQLALVAQDGLKDADWALIYGLSERQERRLHLVLPRDQAFATRQRVPWLTDATRPVVWLHHNGDVELEAPQSREDTIDRVRDWAKIRPSVSSPREELAAATTPAHLGGASHRVADLVEWATRHPQLDASHVKGTRSWHCAGQKVLSLEHGSDVIRIRAGIHDGQRAKTPDVVLHPAEALSIDQLKLLKTGVADGILARLSDTSKYHTADEHWFQSVLRRNPSLVGIESPALREVPAWRPAGKEGGFGRGYIDLLGLDGHGDIRIVEAKLAKSTDDMTLMQGLDYHVWAEAYRDAIGQKLSAPTKAELRLHFVIGAVGGDKQLLPPRVTNYAASLDTKAVPYRFHIVEGWHTLAPDSRRTLRVQTCPESTVPTLGRRTTQGKP